MFHPQTPPNTNHATRLLTPSFRPRGRRLGGGPFHPPFPRLERGYRPELERLTLGFIGNGKMNSGHLNNFLGRKEVQVVAVCDVDTTRRENAKKTVTERYSKDGHRLQRLRGL
jgi:hypothetical protein